MSKKTFTSKELELLKKLISANNTKEEWAEAEMAIGGDLFNGWDKTITLKHLYEMLFDDTVQNTSNLTVQDFEETDFHIVDEIEGFEYEIIELYQKYWIRLKDSESDTYLIDKNIPYDSVEVAKQKLNESLSMYLGYSVNI